MKRTAEEPSSATSAIADKYRVGAKGIWDGGLHSVRSFQDDSKQYVRDNPRKAVFTALGVGLVLGLIFRRYVIGKALPRPRANDLDC